MIMNVFTKRWNSLFGKSPSNEKHTELKGKNLDEVTFVVLDLETSGLHVVKDKVLSFGGIKVVKGSLHVSDSLEKVFKQSLTAFPENGESVKIHGLLKKDTSMGEEKGEGLKEVVDFIGDDIVVGHHVEFDWLMLNKVLEKYQGKRLGNLKLDTAKLAAKLDQGAFGNNYSGKEFGLDELCRRYGIEPFDRHTAAGDAFITAQLLIKLIQLAQMKGLLTVGQLMEKKRMGLI